MPETSIKIPKWANLGRIIGWKKDLTFNAYKKDIELLNQSMYTLKSKDQKTNVYRFLKDFIENKNLYDAVTHINSKLSPVESLIKDRTLEFESIDKQSKDAIIQATTLLLEATTQLNIVKLIDNIVLKHEPTIKKRKEEQEQEAKKALSESGQPAHPRTYPSSGYGTAYRGTGSQADYGFSHSTPSRSSGNYGSEYGTPSSASYPYGRSSRTPSSPADTTNKGYGKGDRVSKAGTTTQPHDQKTESTQKSDLQKYDANGKKKSTASLPEPMLRRVYSIANRIEEGLHHLSKSGLLNPQDIVLSKQSMEPEEIKIRLNSAHKGTDSFSDALNSMRRLSTQGTSPQKQLYAEKLQGVLDEHKKPLQQHHVDMFRIKKQISNIPEDKKFLYLGGPAPVTMKSTVVQEIGKPFNINIMNIRFMVF